MINYIIQVILFQALFVAVYDLFLSKETFFIKNRWYLLSTSIVSFLLPLLKVSTIQNAVPEEYTIMLPEIVLSPQSIIEKTIWYQSANYLNVLFVIGTIFFFMIFIVKLQRIIQLIFKYGSENKQAYKLVLLPENSKAFSFFNYIFLGKGIPQEKQEKIIQHELVHSKQKHTIDLLFFEFLRVLMWFNPMVYVYQKRITLVHEYISDDVVSKTTKKENYINNLLSEIFQVENISFVNQFYKHSLIKKRIIMMTKRKSKEIKQLKYLLLLPLLAIMMLYTSCNENQDAIIEKELTTIYNSSKEGDLTSVKGEKTSFLDFYYGGNEVDLGKELSIKDLSKDEKKEFLKINNKVNFSKTASIMKLKLFSGFNDRKIIAHLFDFTKTKEHNYKEGGDVSFSIIEKSPTFPGCEEGDKKCLNFNVMKFVQENFNVKLANTLGLTSGKKKIYVQFKIGTDGNIIDVKARAPHPVLKEETINMIKKLPKMKPGEQRGKKVRVRYTLPITFNVK